MDAFKTLTGTAAPLMKSGALMANVDTDMIIPKQFLKTVARTGLSKGLFYEMKTRADGSDDPDFVLNRQPYRTASILIAGANFGCGSSREHAPWALLDQGIRCVIAPSFADIFYNNCLKNGILPVVLPQDVCDQLAAQAGGENRPFEIDLAAQSVTGPDGQTHGFQIDAGAKSNLLNGLDEIGQSLQAEGAIADFESRRRLATPWMEKS